MTRLHRHENPTNGKRNNYRQSKLLLHNERRRRDEHGHREDDESPHLPPPRHVNPARSKKCKSKGLWVLAVPQQEGFRITQIRIRGYEKNYERILTFLTILTLIFSRDFDLFLKILTFLRFKFFLRILLFLQILTFSQKFLFPQSFNLNLKTEVFFSEFQL